jgi:hypothetical protein
MKVNDVEFIFDVMKKKIVIELHSWMISQMMDAIHPYVTS